MYVLNLNVFFIHLGNQQYLCLGPLVCKHIFINQSSVKLTQQEIEKYDLSLNVRMFE